MGSEQEARNTMKRTLLMINKHLAANWHPTFCFCLYRSACSKAIVFAYSIGFIVIACSFRFTFKDKPIEGAGKQ